MRHFRRTHASYQCAKRKQKRTSVDIANVAFSIYVTFSKNNPNSHKSFLDFMSNIADNMIHTSDAVSSPSSSFDLLHQNVPPKNDPPRLAVLMEN